jgi:hypothetical protein
MEAERMVRAPMTEAFGARSRLKSAWAVCVLGFAFSGALLLSGGCALAPRAQIEDCQQQSRTLRSENARLKDQLLVLQAQNRDYADRALDDSRRLATQDEAIERLESSVHAYQDERARLESAFHQLSSSIGQTRAGAGNRLSQIAQPAAGKEPPRSQADSTDVNDADDRDRVR